MTKLSVNINKIATLRNSRGGDVPNVVQFAKDVQRFGAQGVTIHPRPDERHIRYKDAYDLKPIVTTEYNIEGNPIKKFMDLVLDVKPTQVTLVPDSVDLTGVDDCAHIRCFVQWIPDNKLVEFLAQQVLKRIHQAFMHIDAAGCRAALALACEAHAGYGASDRLFQIRVLADNHR